MNEVDHLKVLGSTESSFSMSTVTEPVSFISRALSETFLFSGVETTPVVFKYQIMTYDGASITVIS